jgi:hypothetical protein
MITIYVRLIRSLETVIMARHGYSVPTAGMARSDGA